MYVRPTPTRRRSPLRAALVGVVLLAVLGVGAWGIVRLTDGNDIIEAKEYVPGGAAPTSPVDPAVTAPVTPPTVNVNTLEWKRTDSPTGAYSVEMPADARYDSTTQTEGGQTITLEALFTGGQTFTTAGTGLAFMEVDLVPGGGSVPSSVRSEALDSMVEGMTRYQGGTVSDVHAEDSTLGEARRFSVSYSAAYAVGEGWMTIDGDVAVMVLMIAPAGGEVVAQEAVDRVVRSIETR